ncbi:23S rRNA (pseudouridine(1915)-N(3))-methyltransferase RlmH [Clostridium sp. JN-1]|jgi:23S rRNA (pseudouridine1915-N3)-methyltransferase|uniref:23S rRNA (pseudouridine(1915)-N(3))-methyltransferase RlmH n=1 Tax=Clostridium sp. JN-1 TaxID=2483110 RepID=UPI000F0BA4ED|nr:23S rRNA (pseudouridine(1915)-N(3))-methyltransferase RlmH [Clostridium sp. JN-1]
MKIDIVCVGKIKENYLRDAIKEYSKRLSRYCKLQILEVPDEKAPENYSNKEKEIIKKKEGKSILKHIKENSFIITLDLRGKMLSSEEMSSFIKDCCIKGHSNLVFIIGGSLGLSDEVLAKANFSLCFSKMTFPHQLMRVILMEQLYRSYKIMNNEPYHK